MIIFFFFSNANAVLRVQKDRIIETDTGQEIQLRGYNLSNAVHDFWDDKKKQLVMPKILPEWVLTQEDIKDLKASGTNLVRYCFNYELFDKHNEFRAENIKDLKKKLQWLNEANIYVVLNMHVPPGRNPLVHTISQKSIFEDGKLWQQFEQIWAGLLQELKNNTDVAGYEFFNEPQVSYRMSLLEWHNKVAAFINKMRQIDDGHIFVVGNPHSTVTKWKNKKPIIDWAPLPFHKYNDKNILYTFHFYAPEEFTHQRSTAGMIYGTSYPFVTYTDVRYIKSPIKYLDQQTSENRWQYMESLPITPPAPADIGSVICGANLGKDKIYFDDVKVFEIYENNKNELSVPNPSFLPAQPKTSPYEDEDYFSWGNYFPNKYKKPKYIPQFTYETNIGRTDNYSISIINKKLPYANWQTEASVFFIKPKPKVQYIVSGYIRSKNPADQRGYIQIAWFKGKRKEYGKEEMKNDFQQYINFQKKYKAPLLCGEFGTINFAKEEDKILWLEDVGSILNEYNIHWTYWTHKTKYGWGYSCAVINRDPINLKQEYYRYQKVWQKIKKLINN